MSDRLLIDGADALLIDVTDTLLISTGTLNREVSLDALLEKQATLVTASLDARLFKTETLTCGLDAILGTTVFNVFLDARLVPFGQTTVTPTCDLDARLRHSGHAKWREIKERGKDWREL